MIEEAKKILNEEAEGIIELSRRIGKEFEEAVEIILKCSGKVIVMGIGKSGIIGRKIASTLSSTGTPSFFVHASEALHGDTGMISEKDIVIMISQSGETEELVKLVPFLKRRGIKIISITSSQSSKIAVLSDIVLNMGIKKEAGELGLAPTTSSTATLALGDSIAMCLLKKRNFKPEDYAVLHPAGSLGKKLLLKVEDIMYRGAENPKIIEGSEIKEAIIEMSSKGLGAVSIIDSKNSLKGIITDGDLRRAIEKYGKEVFDKKADEIMTKTPISIDKNQLAVEALHLMEDRPKQIMVLPVLDSNKRLMGMIRIHDLVKAGIR